MPPASSHFATLHPAGRSSCKSKGMCHYRPSIKLCRSRAEKAIVKVSSMWFGNWLKRTPKGKCSQPPKACRVRADHRAGDRKHHSSTMFLMLPPGYPRLWEAPFDHRRCPRRSRRDVTPGGRTGVDPQQGDDFGVHCTVAAIELRSMVMSGCGQSQWVAISEYRCETPAPPRGDPGRRCCRLFAAAGGR